MLRINYLKVLNEEFKEINLSNEKNSFSDAVKQVFSFARYCKGMQEISGFSMKDS